MLDLNERLLFYEEKYHDCFAAGQGITDVRTRSGLFAQCRMQFENLKMIARIALALEKLVSVFEMPGDMQAENANWDKLALEMLREEDRMSGQIVGEKL